jgi:hypothetical protein
MDLQKLRALLNKATIYTTLYDNEEFQVWKREVVDKRLEAYKEASLNSEPESDDHKRNTIRYQELKYITEGVFKYWKAVEDSTRKKIS